MPERSTQLTVAAQGAQTEDELRLFPFIVAGLICFTIAVILGAGSWYLFGSRRGRPAEMVAETAASPLVAETEKIKPAPPAENAAPAPTPGEQTAAPEAEKANPAAQIWTENAVEVAGGEVATGGGETNKPIERQIVEGFLIAATEVTNAQYAEFLKETGHPSPAGWNKTEFPAGTGNFPVTNVSWHDAAAFCEWLARKTALTVRLPSEAEWELAARGREGYRYPWGNDWNKAALISKERGGRVSAVRSFPLNRSPFGAFDMAGNVWEWTGEKVEKNETVTDEQVREALAKGRSLRVVKGGSASEPADQISAQARYEIPENTRVPTVGFRYLIERR